MRLTRSKSGGNIPKEGATPILRVVAGTHFSSSTKFEEPRQSEEVVLGKAKPRTHSIDGKVAKFGDDQNFLTETASGLFGFIKFKKNSGDTRSASLELHSQHATLALFSKEGLEFLDLQKTQILKKKQPLELVLAEGKNNKITIYFDDKPTRSLLKQKINQCHHHCQTFERAKLQVVDVLTKPSSKDFFSSDIDRNSALSDLVFKSEMQMPFFDEKFQTYIKSKHPTLVPLYHFWCFLACQADKIIGPDEIHMDPLDSRSGMFIPQVEIFNINQTLTKLKEGKINTINSNHPLVFCAIYSVWLEYDPSNKQQDAKGNELRGCLFGPLSQKERFLRYLQEEIDFPIFEAYLCLIMFSLFDEETCCQKSNRFRFFVPHTPVSVFLFPKADWDILLAGNLKPEQCASYARHLEHLLQKEFLSWKLQRINTALKSKYIWQDVVVSNSAGKKIRMDQIVGKKLTVVILIHQFLSPMTQFVTSSFAYRLEKFSKFAQIIIVGQEESSAGLEMFKARNDWKDNPIFFMDKNSPVSDTLWTYFSKQKSTSHSNLSLPSLRLTGVESARSSGSASGSPVPGPHNLKRASSLNNFSSTKGAMTLDQDGDTAGFLLVHSNHGSLFQCSFSKPDPFSLLKNINLLEASLKLFHKDHEVDSWGAGWNPPYSWPVPSQDLLESVEEKSTSMSLESISETGSGSEWTPTRRTSISPRELSATTDSLSRRDSGGKSFSSRVSLGVSKKSRDLSLLSTSQRSSKLNLFRSSGPSKLKISGEESITDASSPPDCLVSNNPLLVVDPRFNYEFSPNLANGHVKRSCYLIKNHMPYCDIMSTIPHQIYLTTLPVIGPCVIAIESNEYSSKQVLVWTPQVRLLPLLPSPPLPLSWFSLSTGRSYQFCRRSNLWPTNSPSPMLRGS